MKIPNIVEIVQAWKIAAKPTPEQHRIAEVRAAICDGCEFKEFKPLIRVHVCGACKCPIKAKIYSQRGPATCPKNKWTE